MKDFPHVPWHTTLLNLMRFVSNPIPILQSYHKQYGSTIRIKIGGVVPSIISTDPAFAQQVLQKHHRKYKKSAIQTEHLGRFLGMGLLTSDGDFWLRQRRLIQPGFHRDRLEGIAQIMNEVIDRFMIEFQRKLEHENPVDITPAMMKLTFQIVAASLFGTNLKEKDLDYLSHLITEIQGFIVKQVRLPFMRPYFKWSGTIRHYENMANEGGNLIMNYIRDRRENGPSKDDLLQMLLDARYEDTGEGMSDQQIKDESFVLFAAGHETTANALSWTLYLLCKHPEVVQKIRQEAAEVLGDKKPSFSDLPRLTYLMQVIEESMRLYPPAWITDRTAIEDDEFQGVHISKGSMVVPFIYGVHHAEENWPQPEQFRPERFDKSRGDKPGFRYLPFGGGPRLCIGNSFALMEMQLILSRLLQRYDISLAPGQLIEAQPLVTLRPRYGIRVVFG